MHWKPRVGLATFLFILSTTSAHADDTKKPAGEQAVSVDADASAQAAVAPAVESPAAPAAKPKPRFLAALALSFPAHTYLGSTEMASSTSVTIADRQTINEAPGFGYMITPKFRVWLWALFSTGIAGYPDGAKTWQIGGISPEVQYAFPHRIVVTGGPIVTYRFGGKSALNYGAILIVARGFPLGGGYTLAPGVLFANFYKDRFVLTTALNVTLVKAF